jgi:hypothetical protein
MNFPTNHIERIKEFGYTESEARFLYIVAVHSGYFTLGQFRNFTATAYDATSFRPFFGEVDLCVGVPGLGEFPP